MTSRCPPRLVEALLRRLPADREPLVGDLMEEFQQGRSKLWLWRQVLCACARELLRSRGPIELGLNDTGRRSLQSAPVHSTLMGVGGIGSRHVGGLGALAITILLTIVVPQIWWLLLGAALGGATIGALLAVFRARSISSIAFLLVATTALAQEPARLAVPLDPVAAILDAFTSHAVVTLPGGFGASRRALLERLMRDPRFPATVNDIVVEFGSARYQDAMDRYIRGDDVPYPELRRAWQDTPSPTGHDGAAVEEFYQRVRELNASLPMQRRIRVLLGEPPVDWDQIRSKEDLRKWVIVRDLHAGDLIRREVTLRGRKALVLYGQLHYPRKEILTNYDMSNWQAQTLVSWLESMGVTVFNIWAASGGVQKTQADVVTWPHMSLALLRGTVLGAADFTAFDPGSGRDRFIIRGLDDFVPLAREQFRTLRMEDQFDAILYTGGGASDPLLPRVSAKACAEPGYVTMRLARIAVAGLPPAESDAVRKSCELVQPAQPMTGSPFEGRWTADLSRSRLHPNSPLRSATLQFSVGADSVSITDNAIDASGREIGTGTTTFRTDGKAHAHDALMPGLTVVAHWRSQYFLETTLTRKDGQVDVVTYEVSADGERLITTTSGSLGTQVILFERK